MSKSYVAVEYSKSNRAACGTCKQKIDKGVLRVASHTESEDGRKFGKNTHLDCFKIPVKFTYPDDLDGEEDLEEDDQERVKEYFEDDNNRARSAKWKGAAKRAPIVPLDKLDDMEANEKRTALKEARVSQHLEKKFNVNQLKDMLQANGQAKSGTKHDLALRVAKKMLEGSDPMCPRCGRSAMQLKKRVNGTEYWHCPAYYDRDDDGQMHHCAFFADIDPSTGKARKFVPKKKKAVKDEDEDDAEEEEGKFEDVPATAYDSLKRTTWKAVHGENKTEDVTSEVDKMTDDEVDKELRGDGSNADAKPVKKATPKKKAAAAGTKRKRAASSKEGKKRAKKEESD